MILTTLPDLLLPGLVQDSQSMTADWQPANQTLIDGVSVKNVNNVLKNGGYLTELYRRDWGMDENPVEQVFQVAMQPKSISAWHLHQTTTDRLFATTGTVRVVLFDPRPDSPTYGMLNDFRIGPMRPQLIVVPPKVFHGVMNISDELALLLNMVDQAYDYEAPDHWRLPHPHPSIPFQF